MKKFGEGQQPFHAIIDIPEGDSQELTTVTDQALNSLYGELFNLLQTHGINPTTTTNADLKQVARAVWAAANTSQVFLDSGNANIKNLTHIKGANFLFKNGNSSDNGFIIEFLNKTENTGAVTVNVFDVENNINHFNNCPLLDINGNPLQNKALPKNTMVKAYYDYSLNSFKVINVYNTNITDSLVFNAENKSLAVVGMQTVETVAEMLALTKINKRAVFVKSYHADQAIGGGVFVYDDTKALQNDRCTVINGWVRRGFNSLTVWDCGYKTDDAVASKNALIAALTSSYPLQLLDETLNTHTLNNQGVLWQTVTTNKVIFGKSNQTSIINGLRLQFEGDDLVVKDCAINENGLNYAIFVLKYQNLLVENFSSKGNLDAVLIMGAKSSTAKALVTNCYSKNSSRIGFTADGDATNVVFEKCYSYNCRQGFHAEAISKVTFIDCIADKCGDGAMPRIDYQPWEYAGGFRLHVYNDVKLIRCKNINKNGGNGDQIGGGGTDLYMEDCEGINFLTDYDTGIYKNITLKQLKNCGFNVQSYKAVIAGKVILHNLTGGWYEILSFTVDTVNYVEYAEVRDANVGRLQLNTHADSTKTTVVVLDNVQTNSPYFNAIQGFTHYILGDLVYKWDNSSDEHYPNMGYRFLSKNMKSFTLNSFRTIGALTGYHISIEDANAANVKTAMINTLVDEGSSYAFYNPNNVDVRVLSRKGAAVANATATDDTANKLNALLTSLRNAKVIAP